MKKLSKKTKGIILPLAYAAIYYAVSMIVCLVYGLLKASSGNYSVAEIEKNLIDGSFALIVISSIICLWIYLLIFRIRKKEISEYIKTRNVPQMTLIMAAVLAIGCRFLVASYFCAAQKVGILAKSMQNAAQTVPDISTTSQMLIALFSIFIVAPLFEEFLFRGLVMGELMKIMRPWAAITLQAVIFGVAHGVLFQSVFAFVVGIFLGIVYYRTKSIKTAVICHSVFNLSSPLMLESMSVMTGLLFFVAGIVLTALSLFYIIANSNRR